jgi:hypothetical protein
MGGCLFSVHIRTHYHRANFSTPQWVLGTGTGLLNGGKAGQCGCSLVACQELILVVDPGWESRKPEATLLQANPVLVFPRLPTSNATQMLRASWHQRICQYSRYKFRGF